MNTHNLTAQFDTEHARAIAFNRAMEHAEAGRIDSELAVLAENMRSAAGARFAPNADRCIDDTHTDGMGLGAFIDLETDPRTDPDREWDRDRHEPGHRLNWTTNE